MKNLKFIAFALGLGFSYPVLGQKATVENVLNMRSTKQSGTIIENQKLVGYYVFYFKEKVDKKNSSYEVELFDDNYNSVKTFEITRPKNSYLMEIVFNGASFMLHFYDRKTGYEFVTFDKTGEQLGTTTIDEDNLSRQEIYRATSNINSATENVTIFPIGKNAFVRQSFNKNKKIGYEIVAYGNNANELWKLSSDENSEKVETVEILEATERTVTGLVYKRKNAMSRSSDIYILMVDAKTGEKISEREIGTDEQGQRSVLKSFELEENGHTVLVGEFYKPGDDMAKDKSLGLFMQEVDPTGKVVKTTEYKWKGTVDKFKQKNLSAEDVKEGEKAFYTYFHNVIRDENGKIYLVGEQFRKNVNGGAIAMKAIAAAAGGSSDAASIGILLGNMVVMEFDKAYKMMAYDIVPKKKTTITLPEGAGLWSPITIAHYISSLGMFDYAFTSGDKGKGVYNVIYIDANRREEKESKKSDVMLGLISIEAGKRENTRIPINTDAKNWWISPAKPGFISIGEYYRKEKKMEFHLEPIKY